jgi:isochorismate pyruvate lyase
MFPRCEIETSIKVAEKNLKMTDQNLQVFRNEIDAIDKEIVALLARRFGIAEQVAAFKRKQHIAVRLNDRIGEVLDRVSAEATKNATDAESVRTIYQTIIETTCRFEEARIGV